MDSGTIFCRLALVTDSDTFLLRLDTDLSVWDSKNVPDLNRVKGFGEICSGQLTELSLARSGQYCIVKKVNHSHAFLSLASLLGV